MTFDLHIHFDNGSPAGLALETIIKRDRVSPEVAIVRGLQTLAAQAEPDNFDYLFTPERIAEIRAAEEELDTGNNMTIEQVREHFAARREAWPTARFPLFGR